VGAGFQADPAADGSAQQHLNVSYVGDIEKLADGQFQLVVDDRLAATGYLLHVEPEMTDA
jgi:hypothetical protein